MDDSGKIVTRDFKHGPIDGEYNFSQRQLVCVCVCDFAMSDSRTECQMPQLYVNSTGVRIGSAMAMVFAADRLPCAVV